MVGRRARASAAASFRIMGCFAMTTSREVTNVPRVFTIAEVNAIIPTLSQLVADQLLEQSAIEQGLGELTRLTGSSPKSLEPVSGDVPEVERRKRELRQRVGR